MSYKIVLFGGGTGLSNLLSELKKYDYDLTAIVTVADNGGSTGKIRNFYDIPAPGDLRRCAIALSENQDLATIMNYRFDKHIDNHTVGNLILTACVSLYGDFDKACLEYSKILQLKRHKVLPISNNSLHLCATMKDGAVICGEHQIVKYPQPINKIYYQEKAEILHDVIKEVQEADAIIFSCGSLYTSLIPNLLFEELIKVFDQKQEKIIYIANLMTQDGETNNFTVKNHVDIINQYLGKHKLDYVIANDNYDLALNVEKNYNLEKAQLVKLTDDLDNINIIADDFLLVDENNHVRHNIVKICEIINLLVKG